MELIPIALGVLFFIACLVGGLIFGVFLAKGKARWRGLLIAIVGLFGLFPLLLVASPPDMSLFNLSGTYEGNFGGGTTTFVLHPNGTYDQRFVTGSGKVYNNQGTWNLDTIEPGSVDFEHLLNTVDGFGKPKSPDITNFGGAAVHMMDNSIYFNEDEDVKITRTKR